MIAVRVDVPPRADAEAPARFRDGRRCCECGRPLASHAGGKRFCDAECSRAFNNRRAMRGVVLYDLFMALRYERRIAGPLKLWRAACRLGRQWRREDLDRREGRPSWRAPADVLDERPYLLAEDGLRRVRLQDLTR